MAENTLTHLDTSSSSIFFLCFVNARMEVWFKYGFTRDIIGMTNAFLMSRSAGYISFLSFFKHSNRFLRVVCGFHLDFMSDNELLGTFRLKKIGEVAEKINGGV
jgi:hypothetical protein